MDTVTSGPGAPTLGSESTAPGTNEQDGLAGKASDAAKEMAAAAKQGVADAGDEARQQAKTFVHETREQLQGQAQAQSEKLAASLRQVGVQLEALTDGRPQEAGPLADYARQASSGIQRYADGLQQKGVDGALRDVQQFARRRPGQFLLGAAVVGFAAGRLLRNGALSATQQAQPQLQSPSQATYGVGAGQSAAHLSDAAGNWQTELGGQQ